MRPTMTRTFATWQHGGFSAMKFGLSATATKRTSQMSRRRRGPEASGTSTVLDADSKLIVSYLCGGRDASYAMEFMKDVASRLTTRVQITTDGHGAYIEAVEGAFGMDVWTTRC